MRKAFLFLTLLGAFWSLLSLAPSNARADGLIVYTDQLVNGWQNWSWCSVDFASTNYAQAGSRSIKATYTGGWQGLYLRHEPFSTTPFSHLTFWIHGGGVAGRSIRVQGVINNQERPDVPLSNYLPEGVAANEWRKVSIPLVDLQLENEPNVTGFWLMDTTGGAQPTYYVDSVEFTFAPEQDNLQILVHPAATRRIVDDRLFGVNAVGWDNLFTDNTIQSLLKAADNRCLRFPGGSLSDGYDWRSNGWALQFDAFAQAAQAAGSQVFITTNYGSGTAQLAADWVHYANNLQGYGIQYWEIGNECYGDWEHDEHGTNLPGKPHDPITYADNAVIYLQQMKAKDPTIKVGVVVDTDENNWAWVTNYTRPVTNPRTGEVVYGWTPNVLARMKQLGTLPDFIIYHRYEQSPGNENDLQLLTSATGWQYAANNLRQQLRDYFGDDHANVEIVCTENNSVSSQPGKQTTSLVNALYLCDSIGNLLQTEINANLWWDTRNAQESNHNNDPGLYGWRKYGDYGIFNGKTDPYPTYYAMKLLSHFARGGDEVINTESNSGLLSSYAVRRTDGTLTLLVINKRPSQKTTATITFDCIAPQPKAPVYTYGIPQDEAARTGIGSRDIVSSTITNAAPTFSYTFEPYSATVLVFTPMTVQLTGKVDLPYCVNLAQPMHFRLQGVNNTCFREVTLDAAGAFTLTDLPPDKYTISVKGKKWLQRNLSLDLTAGDVNDFTVSLIPGDANNNNYVEIFDLAHLAEAFNSSPGDLNWNENADFNCDQAVDIFDLGILAEFFNTDGDP